MATERLSFLKTYPPFADFSDNDLDFLESVLRDAVFKRGEMIFAAGEVSTTMYVIRKGYVKIFRTVKDDEQTIAVASPGEFFGELALVDDAPRSASVRASDDVIALTITRRNMDYLQARYPSVAMKIYMVLMRVLSGRLRRTFKKTSA